MANNYLQFSTDVPMSKVERGWVADQYDTEEQYSFSIEQDNEGTIFYADESGDVESLADFLQAFLKAHRPTGVLSVEWAETCSRARPGEFAGGAVIITATDTEWMTTGGWVRERLERMENGRIDNGA